jgi:IS1 family transposase
MFSKSSLILQYDEIWSVVGSKKNNISIQLAIYRNSRKIVEVYAGRRDTESALSLWDSLPESCRNNAVFYTDLWIAYKKFFLKADIFPSERKEER